MSRLAEEVLIRLLTDQESMDWLVRVGVSPPEVVPTEVLRGVPVWALDYHSRSGRAPTQAVLEEEFGELLTDQEIDLSVRPEESVHWALETLRSDYVRQQAAAYSHKLVDAVAKASSTDRVRVFQRMAAEIAAVGMTLQSRTTHVDLRESAAGILADYEARQAAGYEMYGLMFGLPAVDSYTQGVHPGEVALVAAATAAGKSWLLGQVAYSSWDSGGSPALYTLENSIKMTELRLACLALHLSYDELTRGRLSEEDLARLKEWVYDVFRPAPNPLHIFSPERAMRTPQSMVAQARAVGADGLVLDQLTYMRAAEIGRYDRRDTVLATIVHDLHELIGETGDPLPCVMAHQINREGVKYARQHGRFEPEHMAEGAEVERTVDMLVGMWASHDQVVTSRMSLFFAKNRRAPLRDFELVWQLASGTIAARSVIAP